MLSFLVQARRGDRGAASPSSPHRRPPSLPQAALLGSARLSPHAIYTGKNFGEVDIDWGAGPTVTWRVLGRDGVVHIDHAVPLSDLSPEGAAASAGLQVRETKQAVVFGVLYTPRSPLPCSPGRPGPALVAPSTPRPLRHPGLRWRPAGPRPDPSVRARAPRYGRPGQRGAVGALLRSARGAVASRLRACSSARMWARCPRGALSLGGLLSIPPPGLHRRWQRPPAGRRPPRARRRGGHGRRLRVCCLDATLDRMIHQPAQRCVQFVFRLSFWTCVVSQGVSSLRVNPLPRGADGGPSRQAFI